MTLVELRGQRRGRHSVEIDRRILADLDSPRFNLVEFSRRVALRARDYVGQHGLRPMDAIHLASAVDAGAEVMWTCDRTSRNCGDPGLTVCGSMNHTTLVISQFPACSPETVPPVEALPGAVEVDLGDDQVAAEDVVERRDDWAVADSSPVMSRGEAEVVDQGAGAKAGCGWPRRRMNSVSYPVTFRPGLLRNSSRLPRSSARSSWPITLGVRGRETSYSFRRGRHGFLVFGGFQVRKVIQLSGGRLPVGDASWRDQACPAASVAT